MTDALVEFLRARLNEDEQAARIISCGGFAPEVWRAEPVRSRRWMQIVPFQRGIDEPPGSEYQASDSPTVLVANDRAEWAHIERWDPARVVAEVDAKRRILDDLDYGGAEMADARSHVARRLAAIYRDHPDYQPEWAPDA